jgi:hypothetical protein
MSYHTSNKFHRASCYVLEDLSQILWQTLWDCTAKANTLDRRLCVATKLRTYDAVAVQSLASPVACQGTCNTMAPRFAVTWGRIMLVFWRIITKKIGVCGVQTPTQFRFSAYRKLQLPINYATPVLYRGGGGELVGSNLSRNYEVLQRWAEFPVPWKIYP